MLESFIQPDRMSTEYIEAAIAKKPKGDDPKDIRIRNLIEDAVLREPWAKQAFANIHDAQISFMREAVGHVDNPAYVGAATQEVLHGISTELRSTIVEGQEHLDSLPTGSPVLIMANHFGGYKLDGINPQTDLGPGVPKYEGYNFMYPYPLYIAGMTPVAEAVGNSLSYTSDDFPGVYGQVHTAAGFIHVPPAALVASGRTEALVTQARGALNARPNTAIVNFPEGGTSGKYNEAGPYDLLVFKTGGLVVASQLDIPVVPVAQFFNPHQGMQLKVFEPFHPGTASREEYQVMVDTMRDEMQEWLTAQEQAHPA